MKTLIDTQFTTDADGANVPDLGGYETDGDVHYSVMDRGDGTCVVRVTFPESKYSGITGATATTELDDAAALSEIQAVHPNAILENLDQPDVEVDAMLDEFTVFDLLDDEEMDKAYIIHNWTKGPLTREDRQAVLEEYGARDLRQLLYKMTPSDMDTFTSEHGLDTLPSGLSPAVVARSVIQNQTRGRQVLQDQEVTAMNKAARVKGLNRATELTKNSRSDMSGTASDRLKRLLDGYNADHADMLDYLKGNVTTPPWDGDANPPAKGNPLA